MTDKSNAANVDNDPRWPARKNPRTYSFIVGKDVVQPVFSAGSTEPKLPAGFYHAYTKAMPDGTRAYRMEPESVASEAIRGSDVVKTTRFFMDGVLSRIAIGRNVGLLLSGLSGSGKTVQARHFCRQVISELGWPVIRIQDPTLLNPIAFDLLYTMVDGPAVYFFEEYDKTVLTACTNGGETPSDKVPQNHPAKSALLASMDKNGDYPSIFLLVCNEVEPLSDYLIARPGRIAYHKRYNSLDRRVVLDWLNEKMTDRSKIAEVINLLNFMPRVSFDVIQELVNEINARPGMSVLELASVVNIGNLVPSNYRVELINPDGTAEPGAYVQVDMKASRELDTSSMRVYATMVYDKVEMAYRPMYSSGDISLKVNEAHSSSRLSGERIFVLTQKIINGMTFESLAEEMLPLEESDSSETPLSAKERLLQAVSEIEDGCREDSLLAIAFNALRIQSGEIKPVGLHDSNFDNYNGRYLRVSGWLNFEDENIVSKNSNDNCFTAEHPMAPGSLFEFTDVRMYARKASAFAAVDDK